VNVGNLKTMVLECKSITGCKVHMDVKLKRRPITHKEVTSKDYAALTASQTGDD
jgi:hypothetical protein